MWPVWPTIIPYYNSPVNSRHNPQSVLWELLTVSSAPQYSSFAVPPALLPLEISDFPQITHLQPHNPTVRCHSMRRNLRTKQTFRTACEYYVFFILMWFFAEDSYWDDDTCQECCYTEAPSAQSVSLSFDADMYGQCSMPLNSDSWDSDFPAQSVPSPEPTILSISPPILQISRPIVSQPTDPSYEERQQHPIVGPIIVRLAYPASQTYYPTDVAWVPTTKNPSLRSSIPNFE